MAKENSEPRVSPPSIDPKEAVQIAFEYFKELYGSPFADLALEEIEKSFDNRYLVTIGYSMARLGPAQMVVPITGMARRYKQVAVDGETGEVKHMKVRTL